MNTTTINLETVLPWGDAKRVNTKRGPRDLMKAEPTPEFWDLWREAKEDLKSAGISISKDKDSGSWLAMFWRPVAQEEQVEAKEALDASKAEDSTLDVPCPQGLDFLPYQRGGIAYVESVMKRGTPGALIGDEMGLGKTIQTIGFLNLHPEFRRILIVCPSSVKPNWKREGEKWNTTGLTWGIAEGSKKLPETDVVVINPDILGKQKKRLASISWDVRVLDEAQYYKNKKAARTKNALGIPAKFRLSLTGTPIENKIKEIHPIIEDLDPETWGNFFAFAKRYCGARQESVPAWENGKPKVDERGRRVWKQIWNFDGSSNEEELQARLRSSIMVRRLKANVLPDLPAKFRQVIALPLSSRIRSIMDDMMEEAGLDREAIDKVLARTDAQEMIAEASDDAEQFTEAMDSFEYIMKAQFDQMSELRREIAIEKIPEGLEIIKGEMESAEKIIVFCHHKDSVAALAHGLKEFGVVTATGDDSATKKDAAIQAFQEDDGIRIIIGTDAIAEGVTLTKASLVFMFELDWRPSKNLQKEDRAHRIGQLDNVLVKYLIMDGTIEARISEVVVRKLEIIEKAMDRDVALEVTERPSEISIDFEALRIHREAADVAEAAQSPEAAKLVERRQLQEEIAAKLTDEQIDAILLGLRIVAGMCDGARQKDGAGFNGADSHFGKSLADLPILSRRQAAIGMKLVRKYGRQIPEDVRQSALGE